jgi:hypothetical protein
MPVELHSSPTRLKAYRIEVDGIMDSSWSESLGGVGITTRQKENGVLVTILTSERIDQAALRGLLIRLWDLNLSLRSIQSLEIEQRETRKLRG